MEITKDILQTKIAEMKTTIVAYNGAIEFAEYLLSIIDDNVNTMSVDDFAQAVGGNGATAEIAPLPQEQENAASSN